MEEKQHKVWCVVSSPSLLSLVYHNTDGVGDMRYERRIIRVWHLAVCHQAGWHFADMLLSVMSDSLFCNVSTEERLQHRLTQEVLLLFCQLSVFFLSMSVFWSPVALMWRVADHRSGRKRSQSKSQLNGLRCLSLHGNDAQVQTRDEKPLWWRGFETCRNIVCSRPTSTFLRSVSNTHLVSTVYSRLCSLCTTTCGSLLETWTHGFVCWLVWVS